MGAYLSQIQNLELLTGYDSGFPVITTQTRLFKHVFDFGLLELPHVLPLAIHLVS